MSIYGHTTNRNKWILVSFGEYMGKLESSLSKHRYLYNPAVLLLEVCLRKWKHIHTKAVAWMVLGALFKIAKKQKQTNCIRGWINVLCGHNGMLFSEIKCIKSMDDI